MGMSNAAQMWGVVAVYLLACIGAGFITARKAKTANAEDYFTSKNQLPPLAVAFSLVGTAMSGAMFLGVPGQAYTKGWPIVFGICMTSGMVGVLLANLLLAKPMRRYSEHHSCTTITEILVDIYEERKLRYILIPMILLGNLFYGMAQWVSIGNLFAGLVGMDYKMAVLIGVAVTLLYTLLGGNSSNALVSVIQMFIACAASIYVIFLALHLSGGFTQMNLNMAAVDIGNVSVLNDKVPLWTFLGFTFIYSIGMMGNPAAVIKFVQIKDHRLYPMCLTMATLSYAVICFVPVAGMFMMHETAVGNMPVIESIDTVMPVFLANYGSPLITGLVIAACLSCIMSTGAALMFSAASSLVKDILADIFHVSIEGKKGVRYSQAAVLVLTVISAWIALDPPGAIVDLAAQAWGLMAACITFPLLFGMRWLRATRASAFWGMITGFVIDIGPFLGIWKHPLPLSPGVTGMFASGIVMIIVSLCTKPGNKDFLPPTYAQMKAAMNSNK